METISKNEFKDIIEAIHQVCQFGWDHWRIWRQLYDFNVTNNSEANYSPAFYQMTLEAHQNCAILSIYKLFDTSKDSMNMNKLLNLVKRNENLFNFEKYNTTCEAELSKHKTQLNEIHEFATNVIRWRHKKVAHFDLDYYKTKGSLLANFPVTIGQFEGIIKTSHNIMNAYSVYLRGHSYGLGAINADDFKVLMRYAVRGKKALIHDREEARLAYALKDKQDKSMVKSKPELETENGYTPKQMAAKLRRVADCLEQGKTFRIQVAGEKLRIPASAVFNFEHERKGEKEELEFKFKWHNK